jgi:sterol desaturase/sphingolipid hydroxylase (fatty acid hydroxylase superfamily)
MTMKLLQWVCGGLLVSAAVSLIALERGLPYRRGQALLRRGALTDFVIYSLVQGYLLALFVAFVVQPLEPIAERARNSAFARLPLFAQIVFFLVTHDLLLYWFHRWQHASRLLWRTHEPHHSNTEIDWVAGSRASPIEIVLTELMKYVPVLVLGAPPQVVLIRGTIDAIWGMYLHCNVDVRSGALQYVVNGPEMHRWHHALDEVARNKNFATKFAAWDWLFGTAYWPRHGQPIAYGLPEGERDGYLAQQLFSLRPRDGAADGGPTKWQTTS